VAHGAGARGRRRGAGGGPLPLGAGALRALTSRVRRPRADLWSVWRASPQCWE
jgi:hypothetical protein